MKLSFVLLGVATVLIFPSLLLGQTCLGAAPLTSEMPIQIGGGASFFNSSTLVAASVTGGSTIFVSGVGGRIDYEGIDQSGGQVSVTVGVQIPADSERRVILCPQGSFLRQFGLLPAIGGGAGVSMGVVAFETPTWQVVPTGNISVTRARFDIGSISTTETFGGAAIGAGLVLNRRVSFVPAALISFGTGNTSAGLAISVSYGLGR